MSVQIKLSNSGTGEFSAQINKFPTTIKVPAMNEDYIIHLLMGLFGTIFGYYLFSSTINESGIYHPNTLFAIVLGGFGAMNIARLVTGPKGSGTLTFHKDHVVVEEPGWLKAKKWQQPLSSYKGIAIRTGKQPKNKKLKPFQIIEMIHEDKSKNLPLYAKRGSAKPMKIFNDYANKLNLKPITD